MRAFVFSARVAVAVSIAAVVAPPALADCYSAYQSCLNQAQSISDNCAVRCGYFDGRCAAFCQRQWQMNGQTCVAGGNRCLALNQNQNGYSDPNRAVYGSPGAYQTPGAVSVPPPNNYVQVPGGYVTQPPASPYPPASGGYVGPQPSYAPAPTAAPPAPYIPLGGYVAGPGTYVQAPAQPIPQPSVICPNAATVSMYRMGRGAVVRSPKPGLGC
jgi:hypothetical protein